MKRLVWWQWVLLVFPVAAVVIFLAIAAAWQIQRWGISWVWGIFILIFLGWQWLLVRWTRPTAKQVEAIMAEVATAALEETAVPGDKDATQRVQASLEKILQATRNDAPMWEDWQTFWQRCQETVVAVAHTYHPTVDYPLLNIYVPQAYSLIRGTVDDMDRWMQQLSPVLGQVTVGQAYQAYEVYRKVEPSARRLWQVWGWAQWILNPAAAVAGLASKRSSDRATQELLANLGQLVREAALRNLCRQAIALYGSGNLPDLATPALESKRPKAQTQTLQEILERAEPAEQVAEKPVNLLLVGRTGAGKSSLINTLFQSDRAAVDVLPSTDRVQSYHWQVDMSEYFYSAASSETLTLWDTPGYEQIDREDLRDLVLDYARTADLLLLVTPALDPALQMDVDFLQAVRAEGTDIGVLAVVTQVDRLRPIREWAPPYDWQWGSRPKETAIREATTYRVEALGSWCDRVVPVVTSDGQSQRQAWNVNALSVALLEAIAPAKQARLARFLRDRQARTLATARIIDRYTLQMTTTQGLTALLKSPVLQFLSTMSTGNPALAYLLAEQIPVEQLPVVIGKLQMAYDLFSVLRGDDEGRAFDLRSLWSLLLEGNATVSPDRNAWAFGHALVEYWTHALTPEQLRQRFEEYLAKV